MKKLWSWILARLKEGIGAPPFPFDDEEGAELWNAGKAEHEQKKASDKQEAERQRSASRPRT